MLKAYASYFVSYLFANARNAEIIDRIILFGSVAKEESTKESDVDIFIEIKKKNNKSIEEMKDLLDGFYKSREALYFKTKGIDNKINLIIGRLDDWKDLKRSIESTGILLYGPYISSEARGKKYSIISWNSIGENRGALLNKVYGVKIKGKQYKGLIEKSGGKKLGKSTIMIPVERREDIIKLLKYHKTDSRIVDVYA